MKGYITVLVLFVAASLSALSAGNNKGPECGSVCGIAGPGPVHHHQPHHHGHHGHHRKPRRHHRRHSSSSSSSRSSSCSLSHCKPSPCPSGSYQVSRLESMLLGYFAQLDFAGAATLVMPGANVTILSEMCTVGQCCLGHYPVDDFLAYLNTFGFAYNINYPEGQYKRPCGRIVTKVSSIFSWPLGVKAYEMKITWAPVKGCQYQIESMEVLDFRCKPTNTLDFGQHNPQPCTCTLTTTATTTT